MVDGPFLTGEFCEPQKEKRERIAYYYEAYKILQGIHKIVGVNLREQILKVR